MKVLLALICVALMSSAVMAAEPATTCYTAEEIQALLQAQSAQSTKQCEMAHVKGEEAVTAAGPALAKLRVQLAPKPAEPTPALPPPPPAPKPEETK